jgi:hypothetical protein
MDIQQRLARIERLLETAPPAPTIVQPVDDCYLSADGCAVLLGLTTKDSAPNRRGFLERVEPVAITPELGSAGGDFDRQTVGISTAIQRCLGLQCSQLGVG